jgi:hypothetical protein
MIKKLITALLIGALPSLCTAKDALGTPNAPKQLHFLENKGQVTDQFYVPRTDIDFSIGGNGMKAYIGDGQIHYQFSHITNQASLRQSLLSGSSSAGMKPEHPRVNMYRMDVELLNANKEAQVVRELQKDVVTRYYQQSYTAKNGKATIDKEITAASYDKITYKEVYHNIDWVIYVKDNQMEYEFVVRPGGDPSDIKIKYKGANSVKVNDDGSLVATTPMGNVNEKTPYSFQEDGRKVNSSFRLNGDVLSFNVDNYTGTLVIDPTLTWGTYFGDISDDEFKSVVYDGTGNIYMTGYTSSTTNMATVGAYQTTNNGLYDAIVTKLSAAGALQWSTFYGTTADEIGWSVNFNGTDLVVAGLTNVFTDLDAMLVKFSTTGAFSYGWAIGGIGDETAYGVDRSAGNDIYLSCRTTATDAVNTVGQVVFGGGTYDGLLIKTDNAGNFLWGTYLGGTGDDAMVAVDVDNAGNIYGSGWTASTNAIGTVGVSQQFFGGGYDGFIARYNASGIKTWGTYWGGASDENILSAEVDGTGNIYVTGFATSTGLATNGAYQATMNGVNDAIIGKYNSSGILQWGTYYGGAGYDVGYGITLDASGNVFVAGYTESTTGIATPGSYDETFGGASDGFLNKFTNAGAISWATYYGGAGLDLLNSAASDNTSLYVAGYTESSTDIAYNTSLQITYGGFGDCVAAKFLDCLSPNQPSTITGSASICAGSTQTYSVIAVTGVTYAWTLPLGWTGTSNTNSITITAGTTGGTISVTASNSCGMSAPQTLNVTVNALPTATITPAGPTTFCQGSSVVLNANTGTGLTYQWYNTSGPITGQTSNNYVATTSGTYTVQVTSNGCSTTSSAVTVTVTPTPATPTVTVNSPVCVGAAANFTATSTTSGVTYNWTGPNNFPNTQNPTIANTQMSDAGSYTCIVTANGCSSAAASVTLTVVTAAPATPSAITGPNPVCAGTSNNVYGVTNDVNASQYNWSLPGGWTGTSSINSISTTAATTGGTISVTAQNGCGISSPSTLLVTVNPLPTPTIVQSGPSLTTTSTYTTYQWYDGSGPIAGATNQSYTPTTNGSYYVVVIDANGCKGQSNNLTFSLSVNGFNNAGNISLYPNPNNGSFTIEGSFAAKDNKVNVEIVDVAGRIVHKQQISISKNTLSVRIDMNASLAPGIYTLKLGSDAQNTVVPFVKK